MEGSHSKRSVQTRFINFFRGLLEFSAAEYFLASWTYGKKRRNLVWKFIPPEYLYKKSRHFQYGQSSESLANLVRELGYRVFDAKTRKVFVDGSWNEVETDILCVSVEQEIF